MSKRSWSFWDDFDDDEDGYTRKKVQPHYQTQFPIKKAATSYYADVWKNVDWGSFNASRASIKEQNQKLKDKLMELANRDYIPLRVSIS